MYSKSGIARILISYDNRRYVVKNYIAAKTVTYGTNFYLAGMIRSHRKPFLFVKIIHNCVPSKPSYEKLFVKEIPRRCIVKGKKPKFCFMGIMELSKLKGTIIKSTGLHKIE
uniref:Transcriptional regulator n=1 Tax=Strongyloides papillosus TaxID=174720 RepID=A0A0N5BRK0_STREA